MEFGISSLSQSDWSALFDIVKEFHEDQIQNGVMHELIKDVPEDLIDIGLDSCTVYKHGVVCGASGDPLHLVGFWFLSKIDEHAWDGVYIRKMTTDERGQSRRVLYTRRGHWSASRAMKNTGNESH